MYRYRQLYRHSQEVVRQLALVNQNLAGNVLKTILKIGKVKELI